MRANAGRTVLVSCGDSRLHPASANGLRSGCRRRCFRFIELCAFSGWRTDAGPCDFFVVFALKDFNHEVREESRSEEHTSELQSHVNLVCRLLLEKKKKKKK